MARNSPKDRANQQRSHKMTTRCSVKHYPIDSTTCATSPTTKTAAGYEPATCRAISPASPTWPSPSFASRGASTPSPKPTGTTPGGPKTPCASSSTRRNPHPRATANPRRLDPPPRQRARSPAVQSELPLYFAYHSKRPRYPPPCPPEPPIPPATAPPQPIPTNHVLILAPNKISPILSSTADIPIGRVRPSPLGMCTRRSG